MAISELYIEEIGPKGDGIHYGPKGRVYVERTAPGDKIKANIAKDQDGIVRGELLKMIASSPYRQNPPCKHYEKCGNCSLQHLETGFYRHWKTEMVKDAFKKQKLRPQRWLEPVFLGGQNRRRATFSVIKIQGKIRMGYYQRRSEQITDIEVCPVVDDKILQLQKKVKPYFDSILKNKETVDVFFQVVGNSIDVVLSGKGKRSDALFQKTLEKMADATKLTRISWRDYQTDKIEILLNKGPVTATFGELKVNLPPAAFLQPTVEGENALVNAVLASLPSQGKFADLFSGCGTFTGPLIKRGSVDAYESVPGAVQALSKAADRNLHVFRRDLFKNPLRREELNRYDAIVFDPPRAGCVEQAERMASSKVRTLVGVSCNPATFARDSRILCDSGYHLHSLQMVDQFLWSHHVEVVGVFTKEKRR